MLNVNRKQLRHSAETKKNAASRLLEGGAAHAAPAVYLCHVAIECALKLRILTRASAEHVEMLQKSLPDSVFRSLINGKTGHDLSHLEKTACLRRALEAEGKEALLESKEWNEMQGGRPFSLRYGYETISADHASRHVEFTAKLVGIILSGSK